MAVPLCRGVLVALGHRGGGSCTPPPRPGGRKSVGQSSPLSWEWRQEPLLPLWQGAEQTYTCTGQPSGWVGTAGACGVLSCPEAVPRNLPSHLHTHTHTQSPGPAPSSCWRPGTWLGSAFMWPGPTDTLSSDGCGSGLTWGWAGTEAGVSEPGLSLSLPAPLNLHPSKP